MRIEAEPPLAPILRKKRSHKKKVGLVGALLCVLYIVLVDVPTQRSTSVFWDFDTKKLRIAANIEPRFFPLFNLLEIFWAEHLARRSGSKEVELELDSSGGDVDLADQIGGMVQRLERSGVHVRAVVPRLGVCASACTIVLASAAERIADPTAILMFHAARHDNSATGHASPAPNQTETADLWYRAVDPVFAHYLENTGALSDSSDELWVLGTEMPSIDCTYVTITETHPLWGRLLKDRDRYQILAGRRKLPAPDESCH